VSIEDGTAVSKTVGVVIFPDVEELDFVGPIEVFGALRYIEEGWQVVTIAESKEPVRAVNGLTVVPDHTFEDCPPLRLVLVPGGIGTRNEVDNTRLLDFVRKAGGEAAWVTSVCTGAFVLRRAGFLDGRRATTYWASLDRLREEGVEVVEERFVAEGNVITAAGVSAGIDMSLYVVGQMFDVETARKVQKLIEYYPRPPYPEGAVAAAGKESH
jgi:transcriptional regulator GlxA family with amidase domain